MKEFDYLLFDLDGTLTDSRPGIFNSIRFALNKYGINPEDQQLMPFLGPPLIDSFMEQFGFTKEQAVEATDLYRVYFNPTGMMENSVYPGVREALETLQSAGKHLLVATSKPETFARKILEHFGLTGYFELIAGAAMDETRTKKAQVLEYLLGQIPGVSEVIEQGRMLMIGDRKYDVLGAKELGLPCLGVAYGYAPEGELESAGAIAVVQTPREIAAWVLES